MWPMEIASPDRPDSLEVCDSEDLQHSERASTLEVVGACVNHQYTVHRAPAPFVSLAQHRPLPMTRESISGQERRSSGGLRKRAQRWSTSSMSVHVALWTKRACIRNKFSSGKSIKRLNSLDGLYRMSPTDRETMQQAMSNLQK